MDNNFRANKELDDKEIASLLRSLARDATDYLYDNSGVIAERVTALSYYRGDPFGTETEHKSDFVTKDVREVVDNSQANLMRVFCGDDESVVSFGAMGMNDVEAAKQATDYIHHCLMNKNYGTQIIGTWIKDAVLQKNGIVKWYWDQWVEIDKIPFEDMPESELNNTLANTDLELDYDPEETEGALSVQLQTDQDGNPVEVEIQSEPTFTGHFKKMTMMEGTKVMNIAPEDFLIDRHASDIHDAKYVAHKAKMTISEIREMGFEVDADELSGYNATDDSDLGYQEYEQDIRSGQGDIGRNEDDQPNLDDSMRRVVLMEEYALYDEDGDGIAELHKVIRIGDMILENIVVSEIPFASLCPYPTTHTFYGQSVADQVIEIQYANSILYRGLLDNLNLANNGRFAVVEGQVNLTDMLDSRPNAIVRTKAPPAQVIQPIPSSAINPMTFEMITRLDASKDKRSGVPSMGMGLGGNELKSHAGSAANIEYMSRADATLEQIARNFTTGFKRLYKGMYQLERENASTTSVMYSSTGPVEITPSDWPRRDMINVQVALGRHDKSQKAQELEKLLSLELAAAPLQQLVSSEKGYNLVVDLLVLKGVDYQRYLLSPAEAMQNQEKMQEMQKAREDEEIQKQLIIADKQADIQKKTAEAQKTMADIKIDQGKLAIEERNSRAEIMIETTQQRPADI